MNRVLTVVTCIKCGREFHSAYGLNQTIWDMEEEGWRVKHSFQGIDAAICPDAHCVLTEEEAEEWPHKKPERAYRFTAEDSRKARERRENERNLKKKQKREKRAKRVRYWRAE